MRPSAPQRRPREPDADPGDPRRQPEAMRATAPRVGSSAAIPGYAVVGPIRHEARPEHGRTQPSRPPPRPRVSTRPTTGRPSASRPPAASCQARVGSE